jgi:hypothetical protein
MGGLRVLITNCTLAARGGSDLYVRDLATALLDRRHTPIVYSPELGDVARELRAATVPVLDNLDLLSTPPDIIHGHHHIETMTALLRFPGVPAVSFCHGWLPWEEIPPIFPRILRYVAVDHTCRDRLLFEHAIAEDRVRVLFNFVDLDRFKPRPPLPPRPERGLIFSNQAGEGLHTGAVREACARAGISVDVVGRSTGNACRRPEEILGQYDIVFAKARSALEALAVGAAVVLCDAVGAGPLVTSDDLDRLRPLNFGIRALREPITPDLILREINRYDPEDAAEVSRRIRAGAGRDAVVDEIVSLYEEVIAEYSTAGGGNLYDESRAAASYLRWLSSLFKNAHVFLAEANRATSERDQVRALLIERERAIAALEAQLPAQAAESDTKVQALVAQLELKEAQLQKITGTFGWRLLSRYGPIKYRFVLPAYRRMKSLLRLEPAARNTRRPG